MQMQIVECKMQNGAGGGGRVERARLTSGPAADLLASVVTSCFGKNLSTTSAAGGQVTSETSTIVAALTKTIGAAGSMP